MLSWIESGETLFKGKRRPLIDGRDYNTSFNYRDLYWLISTKVGGAYDRDRQQNPEMGSPPL
jgi:hypothetical protein